MFRWGDSEFIVETMMPDFSHVFPVVDDTVFDRILQGKNTFLSLGLLSDVNVLIIHSNHDVVILWSSDDGREG